MNSWAIMPFGFGAEVFTWFFRGRLHHPRAAPSSKAPECRGLESNNPRDCEPPRSRVPQIPAPPPGPTCISRTAWPAGLRGDQARSGRLAPPDPAARLPRPEPRSLSSKRTSALWPTRSAPARRVLKVGRPFHKVKGTRKRAGRGVMENQGRPGFSVEGLWEGTPREERVTARARALGWAASYAGERMESGGLWLGTRQRSGFWSRWRWATIGGNRFIQPFPRQ